MYKQHFSIDINCFNKFFIKYLLVHNITMESQFKKQMEKSNTDHAKQFQKVYNSSIINVFKHEINAYLQNKKQKNIKNELES